MRLTMRGWMRLGVMVFTALCLGAFALGLSEPTEYTTTAPETDGGWAITVTTVPTDRYVQLSYVADGLDGHTDYMAVQHRGLVEAPAEHMRAGAVYLRHGAPYTEAEFCALFRDGFAPHWCTCAGVVATVCRYEPRSVRDDINGTITLRDDEILVLPWRAPVGWR